SEFRRLLRTGGRLLLPLRLLRVQHLDAVRQGGERLDVLVGQVGAVAVEGVEVLHRLGVERGERLVVQAGEVLGNLERGPLVLLLGLVLVLRRQAGDAAQAGDRACHHGLLVVGTNFRYHRGPARHAGPEALCAIRVVMKPRVAREVCYHVTASPPRSSSPAGSRVGSRRCCRSGTRRPGLRRARGRRWSRRRGRPWAARSPGTSAPPARARGPREWAPSGAPPARGRSAPAPGPARGPAQA